jgi:hypothetical protein
MLTGVREAGKYLVRSVRVHGEGGKLSTCINSHLKWQRDDTDD